MAVRSAPRLVLSVAFAAVTELEEGSQCTTRRSSWTVPIAATGVLDARGVS
jgi:hypothetical protein